MAISSFYLWLRERSCRSFAPLFVLGAVVSLVFAWVFSVGIALGVVIARPFESLGVLAVGLLVAFGVGTVCRCAFGLMLAITALMFMCVLVGMLYLGGTYLAAQTFADAVRDLAAGAVILALVGTYCYVQEKAIEGVFK